jgi:hypothetical protein
MLQAGACDPVKCYILVVLLPAGLLVVPAEVFLAAGEQNEIKMGDVSYIVCAHNKGVSAIISFCETHLGKK